MSPDDGSTNKDDSPEDAKTEVDTPSLTPQEAIIFAGELSASASGLVDASKPRKKPEHVKNYPKPNRSVPGVVITVHQEEPKEPPVTVQPEPIQTNVVASEPVVSAPASTNSTNSSPTNKSDNGNSSFIASIFAAVAVLACTVTLFYPREKNEPVSNEPAIVQQENSFKTGVYGDVKSTNADCETSVSNMITVPLMKKPTLVRVPKDFLPDKDMLLSARNGIHDRLKSAGKFFRQTEKVNPPIIQEPSQEVPSLKPEVAEKQVEKAKEPLKEHPPLEPPKKFKRHTEKCNKTEFLGKPACITPLKIISK